MTDLEFIFRAICQRRGVTLSKIESVAFAFTIEFGLASPTELLPAVANVFYYVTDLKIGGGNVGTAGNPILHIKPQSGQGSAAQEVYVRVNPGATPNDFGTFECNSMDYNVNNFTAGRFALFATVFKITYA